MYMISDCKMHQMGWLEDLDDKGLETIIKNLEGKGGTSFVPVFEEVERMRVRPDIVLYCTDLIGEYPEHRPSCPVLWLTTNKTAEPPFGEVIVIPEDEVRK
jgi:predicted metal-dependent peptidase